MNIQNSTTLKQLMYQSVNIQLATNEEVVHYDSDKNNNLSAFVGFILI